jgi:hypothetical protein
VLSELDIATSWDSSSIVQGTSGVHQDSFRGRQSNRCLNFLSRSHPQYLYLVRKVVHLFFALISHCRYILTRWRQVRCPVGRGGRGQTFKVLQQLANRAAAPSHVDRGNCGQAEASSPDQPLATPREVKSHPPRNDNPSMRKSSMDPGLYTHTLIRTGATLKIDMRSGVCGGQSLVRGLNLNEREMVRYERH